MVSLDTSGARSQPLWLSADPSLDFEATRRAFRLAIVAHDTPLLLTWAGILVVFLSTAAYLLDPKGGFSAHAADLAVGLLFLIAGLALPRLHVPARMFPSLLAGMLTLLVLALLTEIWLEPSALSMSYVLLVMCAFGPGTLAWVPFSAAAAVMIVAAGLTAITWAGHAALDWTLAALAALLIGAVLLRVRMRSVNQLAEASALIQKLATTDELTGLLNRHGLAMQLDVVSANAERAGQLIFVAFVDIDGLKQANDTFGHDFGDDVIQAVSRAVTETVRQGDLVARWGGDELIIVGTGAAPEDVALAGRLHANIVATGIDLAKWPGMVSIGLAYGSPLVSTIDALITAADADMYRRRQGR
jgi:diguanylate cyclase (GGDEF)-like protein